MYGCKHALKCILSNEQHRDYLWDSHDCYIEEILGNLTPLINISLLRSE